MPEDILVLIMQFKGYQYEEEIGDMRFPTTIDWCCRWCIRKFIFENEILEKINYL